jgi:uncharacterized protein YcbX
MGADRSSHRPGGGVIVTSISYAPVKGLGLVQVDEVELERTGVRENRRFHLIDDDGRLINGKSAGTLVQVAAAIDRDGESLSLRFPDGSHRDGAVTLGDAVETNFYGRPVAGRLVNGGFAEALSQLAGRPLRLVRVDEPGDGSDRGVDGTISALSRGSLDAIADEAGEKSVDGRRFRMLFEVDGIAPHGEDGWAGRRVAIGDAVVRVNGLVGRCAVTSQNPDTGVPDLSTLRVIRKYRSEIETGEPLPFGVWGGVEVPGVIRIGDAVEAL